MKWLGQHVFNFVAYFNDEVFYDGVPDGTIEPDFNLGLDASNRLVKAAVGTNTSSSVFKWYFRDDGDVTKGMSHGKYFKVYGLNGVTVDWTGGSGTDGDPYDLAINTIGASVFSAASLTTPRSINGVGFNGTADITIPSNFTTVLGTLTPANGGTGLTSFTDKSVLITQDSGTSALSALQMNSNGLLMIGGTSGPVANTLTAGSNVTITNTDGAITIAAGGGGLGDTYTISAVDGDNTDEEKIRLTAGGGATDDIVLEAGTGLSIARDSDKITFTNEVSNTNTQNTTTLSFVDSSDDIILRNTTGGAGSGTDDIKFVAGSNITLTHTDADNITIASTASGGGGVYKRNDSTYPTAVSDFTQGGVTYDFVLNNSGTGQRLSILNEQQTGIYYEYLQVGTNLTFNISSVSFQNSSGSSINTSSSYLIGDDGNVWQANCQGLQATLNNVGGSSLSSGTLTTTNRSSSQTFNSSTINIVTGDLNGSNNLVDFRDDLAAADVDLYYPNDSSWSSGYKTLKFNLTLNDGSGNESGSVEWKFYNKIYHGVDSNATLTGNHASNSGAGSIFNLAHDSYATTSVSVNQSFTTSGAQYYHFAYPYRYGAKTSFQIDGGPATGLTLVDDDLTVVNANGYSEKYYHYRTPNSYTDAGPFTITIS